MSLSPLSADSAAVSDVCLSKDRLRAWLRLLDAHRLIENRLREELRTGHDTTLPRFDVLATLDRYRDGLRMSALSAKLRVSNGNVTGIVDRLAEEGLVTRIADAEDRRAMRVRLTPAGVARFAVMAKAHEGWINTLLSSLDAQELDTLRYLLERIGEETS